MVRYCDHIMKKLLDALDKLGLRERTMVIFTTDNGTTSRITGTRNGVLVKGAKSKTIEAGTTVPFIVSQPGTVPSGTISHAPVNITDMMATFAELGGVSLDGRFTYDSCSAASLLQGRTETGSRKFNLSMGGGNNAKLTDKGVENMYFFRDRVVRDLRYKLYIDTNRKPEKLYDLSSDPWETSNLIDDPDYSHEVERLFAFIKDHPAQDADPIYEPLGPQPWDVGITAESQVWKSGRPIRNPQ